MTLNLTIPQQTYSDFTPRITVIGVGGGGTNAVDNMIQLQLQGVEFVVANTDAQQLTHSRADRRVQLGPHLTQGLGAGAKPEIGRAAAEEAADELARHMDGAHMIFITAGMGGGTGTGAAPVIARMARERGILTVGVVTKPFTFEGMRRAKAADAGIIELQQFVDTLIVIPNQNLFRLANERTGWKEAFKMADHVLYMGVRGVTDLMVAPGLVNLDFADIRTVMAEMGKAMMGTGEADGENRAIRAAEAAISNPLLEDTSMAGARGLLINITGGEDMTLFEVDQAANRIREEVAEDANIIFGSAIDENLTGRVRVSVVATGIDTPIAQSERPRLVAVGGMQPTGLHAVSSHPEQAQPGHQPVHTGPIGAPVLNQSAAAAAAYAEQAAHAPAPASSPAMSHGPTHALSQSSAAPTQIGALRPSMPQYSNEASGSQAPSAHALPHQLPNARPASPRSGLFSEPPRQAPEPVVPAPSRSLFGIVTGALRGRAAQPAPMLRSEPSVSEPEPSATVRPAAGEEVGLDIPAFLRRQSN
ncbi:cell division protein FtsZ [Lichenicola cladoniae]|uniref:Cell division protein FtsZ n=1 Tax=Lichenicola cladoniae TaxID=1484109 RepID=A0A6M8HRX5_9PROT|nr:cell division protein FtsZ [Lichenicola cladoniae]NPD65992.1 cell division protein FtsZ [Acetobacteraceae bacterium]QKE91025.1 cell division protein FtsZ [Lichenicola cladoniae]